MSNSVNLLVGIALLIPCLAGAQLQRYETQCRFESCVVHSQFHLQRPNENLPPVPEDYVAENELQVQCNGIYGYDGPARVIETPNGIQIRTGRRPQAVLTLNPVNADLDRLMTNSQTISPRMTVPIYATLQIDNLIQLATCQIDLAPIIPRYYLYMNGSHTAAGPISGFQIDSSTGALTPILGSPFFSGIYGAMDVAASRSGRSLVVTEMNGPKLHAARIRYNGQLKLTSTYAFEDRVEKPWAVAVTPDDKFVYTYHPTSRTAMTGSVRGFSLGPTGVLAPLPDEPISVGGGGDNMRMHPNGRFVYTVSSEARSITGLQINPGTGKLTHAYTIPIGATVYDMAFNGAGTLAYVTADLGKIYGFKVNPATGSLSHIPGSPFSSGTQPWGIAFDPMSRWIFTANRKAGNVFGFAVDVTAGTITPTASVPYRTEREPTAIVVDPTGSYVYVVNRESSTLVSYAIDPATGALTELPTSPMRIGWSPDAITTTTRY